MRVAGKVALISGGAGGIGAAAAKLLAKEAATRVIGKQQTASWIAVTTDPDIGKTLQLHAGDNSVGRDHQKTWFLVTPTSAAARQWSV
jgi:NAD(P)-dependent dehydrogenase (short-subunit alcohol dehydrogenase family)